MFLFVVFFSDVGGSSLDSHHGFVVEYGMDRDVELGRSFLTTFAKSSVSSSNQCFQALLAHVVIELNEILI